VKDLLSIINGSKDKKYKRFKIEDIDPDSIKMPEIDISSPSFDQSNYLDEEPFRLS